MNKFFICCTLLSLLACRQNANADMEELDLMSYGVPILIRAPLESEVKVEDLGVWKDITVKSGEDYFVQIISSEATSLNIDQIKQERIREARTDRYFSKIIQEDEHGFIFEKDIDSVIDYDFRYIKVQGSREFVFQTGLYGTFSEEEVRKMYASVQ